MTNEEIKKILLSLEQTDTDFSVTLYEKGETRSN